MLPIDVRQMKKMMKQMGIEMEEVYAEEVVIKTNTEDIVFKKPSVTKISAKGFEAFQIVGNYEVLKKFEISEEDVKILMEQAKVDETTARKALIEAKGDLAEALIKLQK
ncbi:MAG: nascent polypeptide-associated complex protein [Archaeoglobaceae archaeon]|nr:nascent polypeptide-associated complex protein [Archaeoglobaceae archaeon]MCX8152527.1 nascent polypeptide-associated complex protein [Archaeoglobaceae archaeon]MDW8014052.1 nascent polypeptide-associated complex protein [Archaeoglobaceae archaeon]